MGVDIDAAARRWSEQLVDLTGRNNLLFYRRLKVGTLDLDEPEPTAFARLLRGGTVRSGELSSDPADAGRRLRVIAKTAQSNFEEKGLRTSHLAVGLATWDPGGPTTPNSPVLLAPLVITSRGSAGTDFDVAVDGDWVLNPTLIFKLLTDFGVTVDLPADLDPDDDGFDPVNASAALSKLEALLSEVPGFTISDASLIGNFSYSRQPMVDDLAGAVEQLGSHLLIRALAGDPSAALEIIARHPEVSLDMPDNIEPRQEFLVLDADASQHHVINAAVSGADLVVQGPPGTGKSQTIANLIATLVSHKKSVLFVAQKRAAIDAVTKRLDDVGLGSLVMDLHDGVGSRRRIAAMLAEALGTVGTVPAVDRAVEDAALVSYRSRLNEHSAAINRRRDPWGVSVFDLQSELLTVGPEVGCGVRLDRNTLRSLTVERVRVLGDDLSEWVNLGGPALGDPARNPWAPGYGSIRDPSDAQQLLTTADAIKHGLLQSAGEALGNVLQELAMAEPTSVGEWSSLLAFLDEIAALTQLVRPEAWTEALDPLVAELEKGTSSGVRSAAASVFSSGFRAAKRRALHLCPAAADDLKEAMVLLGRVSNCRARWAAVTRDGQPPRPAAWHPEARRRFDDLHRHLTALGMRVGSFDTGPLGVVIARIDALCDSRDLLVRMPKGQELESALVGAGLAPVLAAIRTGSLDAGVATRLLQVVWIRGLLDEITANDPAIGAFTNAEQDRRRGAFIAADHRHITAGRDRVRRAWAEWVHEVRDAQPAQEQLISREAAKKTRHRSLRDLFAEAPELLQALRPCWTMSPLVVSQLLPAVAGIFDVVVFDEASQVLPAEAIPALLRGKRAVVAGDSKQLPPTTFFDASTAAEDLEPSPSGVEAMTDDMESILDSMTALLPTPKGTRTLTWHYRSQDERLIAFSNVQESLYRGQMVTFPGVVDDAVEHVLVRFDAGVGNEESVAEEVRTVVDLIADHAQRRPHETLGVIALGIRHADRIDMALRQRRQQDPVLDEYLAGGTEPAFVKNLERVQGDERDAIILTLGFGRGPTGTLRHQFGPINQAGGERRLNVAITRARRRLTLVSSFSSTDLDPAKLNSEGPQMLRRYLEYVESRGARLGPEGAVEVALNPFESDVLDYLQRAGLPVTPQYGVSGYRIDFAIAHPDRPGEMVLAVESDGASYHSSPTARERDRLRQEHLERLGWRFCRIWSTSWFRDRDGEVARVVTAWRAACAESDQDCLHGRSQSTAQPTPRPPEPDGPGRRGTCPISTTNGDITKYNRAELAELVRWINSDTLLRSEDQILQEVMTILNFGRRGSRIVAAVQQAIADATTGS